MGNELGYTPLDQKMVAAKTWYICGKNKKDHKGEKNAQHLQR
jgi:hypothetical protein